MSNHPEPDWGRLAIGEYERAMLESIIQTAAHPERKALTGLYGALTVLVLVLTVLAVVYVGWVLAR